MSCNNTRAKFSRAIACLPFDKSREQQLLVRGNELKETLYCIVPNSFAASFISRVTHVVSMQQNNPLGNLLKYMLTVVTHRKKPWLHTVK